MNLSAANGILFHETVHLFFSLLVAFFIWRAFKDKKATIIAFLVGIFLDVDHWFDYFFWFGLKISLRDFFNVTSYIHPAGKVYIPLHGWEWLSFYWLIGKVVGKKLKIKGLEWAVFLSALFHLLWDNFSFNHHPLAYSFFFRVWTNFSLKKFDGL